MGGGEAADRRPGIEEEAVTPFGKDCFERHHKAGVHETPAFNTIFCQTCEDALVDTTTQSVAPVSPMATGNNVGRLGPALHTHGPIKCGGCGALAIARLIYRSPLYKGFYTVGLYFCSRCLNLKVQRMLSSLETPGWQKVEVERLNGMEEAHRDATGSQSDAAASAAPGVSGQDSLPQPRLGLCSPSND